MKSELKHKIKQDELLTGYQNASTWAGQHWQDLKVTIAIVVAVAVLGGGLYAWQQKRRQQAEDAFTAAQQVYDADVKGEKPAAEPAPGTQTYATAAEKYGKAVALFDDVAHRYGSMDVGRRARYYAALCRIELGQLPQAEKDLGELSSADTRSLEGSLARVALAEAHRRAGQLDKAATEFKQLAEDSALAMPRDFALMQLGQTLEDAKRYDEAAAAYQRLSEEFPSSAYASDARQRAEYLKAEKV